MDDRTPLEQRRRDATATVVIIPGDREAAQKLLGEWLQNDDPDDIAEQQATFEALMQALD